MGERLKVLVALALVALLAAVGWWGWSEWRASSERMEAEQFEADSASQTRALEREEHLAECRDDVAAWEAGDRDQLEEEFGRDAEEIIANCLWMLEAQRSERTD